MLSYAVIWMIAVPPIRRDRKDIEMWGSTASRFCSVESDSVDQGHNAVQAEGDPANGTCQRHIAISLK